MRIKEVLKEKGVTAKELAERIGVSQPAISFAINGNPTAETLTKIAAALGVQVGDLFERRGDFVAFVRNQGKIYTFDAIKALKEYADAAHKAAENMRKFGEVVEEMKGEEK